MNKSFTTTRKLAAFLLIAMLVSGCSRLNEFAVIGDHEKAVSFSGISNVLDREKHVNVIFIHGMGGYACPGKPICDPAPIIQRIQAQYPHLKPSGGDYYSLEYEGMLIGSLSQQRTGSDDGRMTVDYYVLDWSWTVLAAKDGLKEDDEDKNSQYRLGQMNEVKRSLVNANLADAALYMGSYKNAMQRPVAKALSIIANNSAQQNRANVIVTFSLGSSMTFDTIEKLVTSSDQNMRAQAGTLRDNTRLFFMLANQLPLIALSEVPSDKTVANAATSTSGIRSFVDQRLDSPPEPWIIAISDPNDQLSYPIFDQLRALKPNTFVTVFTSISKTGYWIPTFGTVTDPVYAHTGYGIDEKTIDLLINGYSASAE